MNNEPGYTEWSADGIPKIIPRPCGEMLIKRDRMITETTSYNIYKLSTPSESGATHAAINAFGDPVVLLGKDTEGVWVVVQQLTVGVIDSFCSQEGE